ncbi:MAG: hypothetical protein ACYS9Y_04685 [Planctomycetota bacterium]|jgi:hypothetical protein
MWDFHLQSVHGRWDGNSFGIDFNKDGVVNLFDFAKLANVWFEESTKLPEDLNYDNTVDVADLQIFAEYFSTVGYKGQWVFDALTSPCIDAGDPNSHWSNETWPNGKRINMAGRMKQAKMVMWQILMLTVWSISPTSGSLPRN